MEVWLDVIIKLFPFLLGNINDDDDISTPGRVEKGTATAGNSAE